MILKYNDLYNHTSDSNSLLNIKSSLSLEHIPLYSILLFNIRNSLPIEDILYFTAYIQRYLFISKGVSI